MFGKPRISAEDLRRILDRLDELETRLGDDSYVGQTLERHDGQLSLLKEGFDDLVEENKQITLAVAEGIERVDRAHRRIQQTVTRARKELRKSGLADPGLEAEAEDLALIPVDGDDEGSATRGVPPVSREVVETGETPSSIPGVSAEILARVRGVR